MRLYKVCGASFYEIFLPTELLNPLCCSPNSAPSPLLSCIYTHSFPSFPSPFFSFPSPSALTFAFGLCFLLLLRREEPGWCRLAWFGLVWLGWVVFPLLFSALAPLLQPGEALSGRPPGTGILSLSFGGIGLHLPHQSRLLCLPRLTGEEKGLAVLPSNLLQRERGPPSRQDDEVFVSAGVPLWV